MIATTLPFAEKLNELPDSPAWLTPLRQEAANRYRELGLPTQRLENWKYTSLSLLQSRESSNEAGEVSDIAPLLPDADRLVFVNGVFDAEKSNPGPHGKSLKTVINEATVQTHLGKIAPAHGQAILALNTALFQDGFVLEVPADTHLDCAVEIVFIGSGSANSHARLLVIMGENSSATIIERHEGDGAFTASQVSEIKLEAGARLKHYRIQNTSHDAILLASGAVDIGRDATYESFSLVCGAKLSRHQLVAKLGQPGAMVHLNGVHILDGERHADTTTLIDHAAPHCASRETYHQIVDDYARCVFQGKILVREGAQKTDGFQLNRSLMLSPTAEVNARPELEIYADDVKCSHGATSGRLDEDALFYLRARGIPEARARALLIEAFANAATDLITDEPIREKIRAHISSLLGADE